MISLATHHGKGILRIFICGFIIFGLMILFSSIVKAEEVTEATETKQEAVVKTVVVQTNIGTDVYTTSTETVGDFLEEQGIALGDLDIISVKADDPITKGLVINIKYAEDVKFCIDGKEDYSIYMNVNTIGEALALLKEEKGINYTLDGGYSSAQAYNVVDVIPVVSEYNKVETKIVDYYYETETVENPDLEEGVTNVLSEGVVGKKELTVRINYVSGEAKDVEVLSEKVLKAPVNKVVEVGTKVEEPEPVYADIYGGDVVGSLTMNSSAYSIDYACTGKSPGMAGYGITASGMRAGYGVVAVDPRVIPLGTKLYVEGYGYCIAGDTGGAIKGNKIDLCFNSYSEAVNYGRKNVTVYILA